MSVSGPLQEPGSGEITNFGLYTHYYEIREWIIMALSKMRKVDSENRIFRDEWTEAYAFILPSSSSTRPVCLICSESVAVVKSGNIKRHFETRHKTFNENYPPGSPARTRKIGELKGQYERATRVITQSLTAQQRAYECSLRVQWILGKHKKPFTDSGMVKECMEALADTLFEGKEGQQLKQKVRQIPLSSTTTTRRAELLSEDVQSQLDSAIQSAPCITLAADESTDVSDNAQLLVYVRFYHEETKTFVEDILGVTALKRHRQGRGHIFGHKGNADTEENRCKKSCLHHH